MKTIILTILEYYLIILTVSGQIVDSVENLKWGFSFCAGKSIGYTGHDLLDAVNTLYPDSYNIKTSLPGLNWSVDINRILCKKLKIELNINNNAVFQISSSKNYFSYFTSRKNRIEIGELSTVISYNFKKFVYIGTGLSLYRIKPENIEHNESGTMTWTNTKNLNDLYKIGIIIKSTLEYSLTKRLYTQLNISYRYIGKADKIELDSGRLRINMGPVDIINYGYNIRMSNLFIGMGLGIKL